jgi:hypothetical protein
MESIDMSLPKTSSAMWDNFMKSFSEREGINPAIRANIEALAGYN